MVPVAAAHGARAGRAFTTGVITEHLRSNATIIETFLPQRVTLGEPAGVFLVQVNQLVERDLTLSRRRSKRKHLV